MVRREKMRTAEDHNAMMARLSSKVSKLTLTVTMRYSRNSPCDHSRKGPALVTITFVEPCLNCGLNFVMKSYRKRPRPLLGLPNWTSPLFLSSRKRSASIVLLGLDAVSDQLSSYRRPLSEVIANESFDRIWMSLCYIHTLFTVPDPDLEMGGGEGSHLEPYVRGRGGRGWTPLKIFSALQASVWFKNKGEARGPQDPPLDPPLV